MLKEAAAIQSSPSDYESCVSEKDVYTMIDNAVPCLLAMAIAEDIKRHSVFKAPISVTQLIFDQRIESVRD